LARRSAGGDDPGRRAYHIAPDHLGAPYKIVNPANAQVWFWDHDPFGNGAPTAAAGFWHRLRFPGQVYDSESKLHSNGQRDYDPRLGRYVESDPIGLEGGINTYAYANNNPVNSVDPSGAVAETPWDAFNVGLGVSSLLENLAHGNFGAAAVDVAGLAYDGAASAVPFLPGGASTAIALGRGAESASNVVWNNGWRTLDGKFASPLGGERAGAAAEQGVWNAVAQKQGWSVIEGGVSVRNAAGDLRVYDGAAISPSGQAIGLEVKSGGAYYGGSQAAFDAGVSTLNPAIGVGQNAGLVIGRSLLIRRP
jgi:RHS repeat-associated protein